MTAISTLPRALDDLLEAQDGVLDTQTALTFMSPDALRWRIESERWQQPCQGITVTHSGPLTDRQRLWVATLWAGPGAVLAGLTAARLDGLRGFDLDVDKIFLLRPISHHKRMMRPPLDLVLHYSRNLQRDVHPAGRPPRTKIDRSLVDAATWMATERGTQAILAAGVQQQLTRVSDLSRQVECNQRRPRRRV